MKRRFAAAMLFLTLCLMMAGCAALGEQAEGAAEQERLHGFTLLEERMLVSPPALMRLWVHDKTGAQVFFIENDDPDKTFSIMFRTEPSDDTGKLHILEHAVCASSEKYPGHDVFFDAVAQAYITDINAATYKSATSYYVSSMSEDQLERMADFYLDCAFSSGLRTQPNYFLREGWRYTMEDADAPLTIDGVVYNEMKGLYGDMTVAHYYGGVDRALFPDTYQQWESGGIPEAIPELTYEELIAFYDSCYHPSNSTSMFYGDVETERYLRLLDEEYFSKFDRQPSAGYAPAQKPFEKMAVRYVDFPVSKDSGQTGGMMSYAVALPEGTPFEEMLAMMMGMDSLGNESSALMQALHETGIAATYYTDSYLCGTQLVLEVSAYEADTARAEEFRDAVLSGLRAAVDAGLDREVIRSRIAEQELQDALFSNQKGVGIAMASRLTQVIDNGCMELLDPSAYQPEANAICESSRLEALLRKHLLENTHAALVVTAPKPGLLEEREQAQAQALAEKKAAMSDEEIARIVESTAAFKTWNDEGESDPQTLEKLRTETPQSVLARKMVYPYTVTQMDGATLYSAEAPDGAAYCEIIFDLSHMDMDELRTMDVYLGLLGSGTEKRGMRETTIAQSTLLTDLEAALAGDVQQNGRVYPALSVSFYALDENVKEAAALVMEMLRETDLEAALPYMDAAVAGKMQAFYDAEALDSTLALHAAKAGSDEAAALTYELFGLDFYDHLKALEAMDDEDVAARMAEARTKAFVREGASVLSVGGAKEKQARDAALCAMLPAAAQPLESGDWTQAIDRAYPKATAFRSNSSSTYIRSALDVSSLGLRSTGSLRLLADVIEDMYLLPELRYQMGAYGASMSVNAQNEYSFKLYRAPAFEGVMERVGELPGEMEQALAAMTQEELAGYQLSRISAMTRPEGPWNEAAAQLDHVRRGMEADCEQRLLDEVCAATPQSLADALPQLRSIIGAAGFAVIAPGAAVDAGAQAFEEIVQLP